ncbi:MAG: hypothetical protein GVY10_04930 [Verrucomicrobia bacterium]|jgi:hypothetical protein|nr:hypothetical protein [Verrucomicrobiota bacterium]
MARLIDQLPGVAMPVEEVTETLRHMWDTPAPTEDHPLDFRASQMNLILHFGLRTTPDEATTEFDRAIAFAQTYPCRLIVLCPAEETGGPHAFEGKLFSQCYLGRHLRETCCCEALILGYSPEESDFLESQVSIWLEPDLPTYHWLHRVPPERVEQSYEGFLKDCRRIIYDGAVEGDAYDPIPWPDPDRVRDLSLARSLPLRQHIGQFLSGFPPAELAEGLRSLKVEHDKAHHRMAGHLLAWQRSAIKKCFADPLEAKKVEFSVNPLPEAGEETEAIRIEFSYTKRAKTFVFAYQPEDKAGSIRAKYPSGAYDHSLHIEPLPEATVLAEALFFA